MFIIVYQPNPMDPIIAIRSTWIEDHLDLPVHSHLLSSSKPYKNRRPKAQGGGGWGVPPPLIEWGIEGT